MQNVITKTLFYCTFTLLFAVATALRADVNITPAFTTLDLGSTKQRTKGQFEIVNTGTITERYRIKATHFILNEDGGFDVVNPDERSLASWVKFSPKEFEMPPNSKRVVRYVVQPRGKPEDGYYWAAMELESLNVTRREIEQGDAKFSIGMGQSILVPIFGKLGNLDFKGEIAIAELKTVSDGTALVVKIQNLDKGGLFFNGIGKFIDAKGTTVEQMKLDGGVLLPNKKRIYTTFLNPKLAAGDYRLRVEYHAPGLKEPLVKELSLAWKG